MTPKQKVSRLNSLLSQAEAHQAKPVISADFIIWREHVISSLETILGPEASQVNTIKKLTYTYTRQTRIRGVDYSDVDRPRREANYKRDLIITVGILNNCLSDALENVDDLPAPAPSLAALHPTIQQAANSLYATGHYRQALLDAFIAVDNTVQTKSQLAGSGTRLMEVAFSPGNPVLKMGDSSDEQQGFMALFRGAMLAIRNPKAHSLNGTHDAQRALEWLSFASVLLRNLDEATLTQSPSAPSAS